MKKLFGLLLLLAAVVSAHAQTYPSPTFKNVTVQGKLILSGGSAQCTNFATAGGVGDGTTDNTAALNAVLSAPTTAPCVYFPFGKYRFNSPISYTTPGTGPASVTFQGDGSENTILFWPSGNGMTINVPSIKHSLHLSGLSFTTGAASANTAINLVATAASSTTVQRTLTDIGCRGDDGGPSMGGSNKWTTCINISALNEVTIDKFNTTDTATAISIAGNVAFTANPYAFNYLISNSMLTNVGNGISMGDYVQGVSAVNTNFSGNFGVNVSGGNGVLCCLTLANDEFNETSAAVSINPTASVFFNYQISNSLFFINSNTIAINVQHDGGGTITGDQFTPQGSATNTTAIALAGTLTGYGAAITGNTCELLSVCINLTSTALNTAVNGNVMLQTSTPIVHNGVGSVIANNKGYNPVGNSSAAYAVASGGAYTAGPSPETHYLSSGTAFTVQITGAGTICNSVTTCQVQLDPGAVMAVSYSVAPTDAKTIH